MKPIIIKKVKNVSDFLRWINNLPYEDTSFHDFYCYRGQSNKDWPLTCSLQRSKKVHMERKLLKTLKIVSSSEFSDSLTSFNYLAKAQHYGLPTRLIDFSLNPLVALYFACSDEKQKHRNGKVIAYIGRNREGNKAAIETVCSYWKFDYLYNRTLDQLPFFETNTLNESYNHIFEITHLYLDELFAIPNYISPREENQKAVFLVCIDEINKIYDSPSKLDDYYGLCTDGIDHNHQLLNQYEFSGDSIKEIKLSQNKYRTVEIAAGSKDSILQELDRIGISKSFLFPELENKVSDMVEHIDKY